MLASLFVSFIFTPLHLNLREDSHKKSVRDFIFQRLKSQTREFFSTPLFIGCFSYVSKNAGRHKIRPTLSESVSNVSQEKDTLRGPGNSGNSKSLSSRAFLLSRGMKLIHDTPRLKPTQAFINGCFNWMIANLYNIGNGCFTKHPF